MIVFKDDMFFNVDFRCGYEGEWKRKRFFEDGVRGYREKWW